MTDLPIADDGIYVASVGAQTPVGRSALQAAAAVRCGISASAEHPFMIDRFGEPMVVAMAGWIPAETSIEERIVHLGAAALLDVLQQTTWRRPQDSIAVYVALSTTTLPEPAERKAVVAKIEDLLRGEGFSIRSEVFAEGNAAGVLAIQAAAERLRNGREQAVVVLGADSSLDPSRLDTLDAARRLHSIDNSWGFTPGEGAGAVLLLTGRLARLHRLTPLARVSAVGVGTESNVLGTKTVCVGEGLTTAFRAALSESD
jgi:3-oxoacyl-[acyl-carrier-protein] synthase-1